MVKQQQNKLICIFGLGQSGVSAARYLERTQQHFFVVDSREKPPGDQDIQTLKYCQSAHYGSFSPEILLDASVIILSPGVSPKETLLQQAVTAGVEVIGDIELFVRLTKQKIVAITGSNGKSTVTDLVYRLLCAANVSAKIGGNFGVPALDYLPQDDAEIYVLELSSFQLDTTTSLAAEVAVLLNISEDHMDRYDNFEEYRDSKLSIANGAKKLVFFADDNNIPCLQNEYQSAFSFSQATAKYAIRQDNGRTYLAINSEHIIDTKQLSLTGRHNWSNALAALAVLSELNIDFSPAVMEQLRNYRGLNHRFQLVARKNGIDWVNDSKATNVGATEAALMSVDTDVYNHLILIAGGDAKGSELLPLKRLLKEKVSHTVLIGKDAELFAELLTESERTFASDMQQAVEIAATELNQRQSSHSAEAKAMVLLSPACASLDMYKNFEARGAAFADAVAKVIEVANKAEGYQ